MSTLPIPSPDRAATDGRRRLVPGVHVVDRDDDHVQVGLDPPARVLVPRDADLLSVLHDLRRGRAVRARGPRVDRLLHDLSVAGLVTAPRSAPAPVGAAIVVDRGFGVAPLTHLLRTSGVSLVAQEARADLAVVVSPGPVPRAVVDHWVRDGRPHLVLAGAGPAGSLRLGPLVLPGLTACLRCVDAAESTPDPRRPLAVEQLAALPPAPLDPALVALALGWAAREVRTFLRGDRPLTWSTTVDLDGPAPVVRSWQRHPHCGCAWDAM